MQVFFVIRKIHETIKRCTTACEATHGKAQKEKASMRCWKWENQKTKIVPTSAKLKHEIIKELNVGTRIKTLGTYENSSLS